MSAIRTLAGAKVRALMVGSAVALSAVATLPAQAAGGVPELVGTSVDSGWSTSKHQVAARYDRALHSSSSAVLVDKNGTPVDGDTDRMDGDYRALIFTADAEACNCPLNPKLAPYTITFTATSLGESPDTTTTTRSFRIDTARPFPPLLDGSRVNVLTPGSTITVSGKVEDPRGPSPTFFAEDTSGIARVELRVFNALESTDSPLLDVDTSDLKHGLESALLTVDDEIVNRRHVITSSCAGGYCPHSVDFSVDLDLPTGAWHITAVGIDLAGNASGASKGQLFIKA